MTENDPAAGPDRRRRVDEIQDARVGAGELGEGDGGIGRGRLDPDELEEPTAVVPGQLEFAATLLGHRILGGVRIGTMKIPVLRLDEQLPLPDRAHPGDAGIDLRSAETLPLAPGARALVGTGIAVAIPEGHAGLVVPRSGLATRHGITVLNGPGLIDAGYRGEIRVALVNLGTEPYQIERGERIAQLVVTPVAEVELVPTTELPGSTRGTGGFGSTGSR